MSLDVISEHVSKVMKTKVDSIMTEPTTIDPSMKVSEVIAKLAKSDTFDAFSRYKNNTFNINTRDLLQGKDITRMSVEGLLHTIPHLSVNDNIAKAVDIITNNGTRAAPVVRDDQIIGTVESKNILKLVSELDNRWIQANQFFTPNPVVIDKQTSLASARKMMNNKRIDHLPVSHKGSISQVLTSYHLLTAIIPPERLGKKNIGSAKIRNLESSVGNLGTNRMAQCSPLDNLSTVLHSMLHANTTFCLVTLRSGLQGIITYRDILNLLAKKERAEVPLFVLGMPYEDNASLIIDKFKKSISRLSRTYPDIQEVRVYVKKIHGNDSRYNFEVSVMITAPPKQDTFSTSNYDLSKAFNEMSAIIMRKLSKKAKRRNKFSVRKMAQ